MSLEQPWLNMRWLILTQKIGDWLKDVSLSDIESGQEEISGVNLQRLHSAKGLEFPCVYIVGVEDGLIPHTNSMDASEDIEEDACLCRNDSSESKALLDCSTKAQSF